MYVPGFLVLRFSGLSQCIYYVLIWVSFQIEVTKIFKNIKLFTLLTTCNQSDSGNFSLQKNLKYQNNKNKSINFLYDLGTLEYLGLGCTGRRPFE